MAFSVALLFFVSIVASCTRSTVFADLKNGTDMAAPGLNNKTDKAVFVEEILDMYERSVKVSVKKIVNSLLGYMLEANENGTVTIPCTRSLLRWMDGIINIQEWAIEMIDASGKPSPAILKGTSWFGGDYDQCLGVGVPKSKRDDKSEAFRGQYCMLKTPIFSSLKNSIIDAGAENEFFVVLSKRKTILRKLVELGYGDISRLPFELKFDVCVPSLCTTRDVEEIAKLVLGDTTTVERCHKTENVKISSLQITCCAMFAVMLGWVVIGTTLDLVIWFRGRNTKEEGKILQFLTSASVYKGTTRLVTPDKESTFDFTYGMRFLSILWIILSHVYLSFGVGILGLVDNMTILNQLEGEFLFSVIPGGYLGVDTFFILSAFFQIISNLKDPKSKINYFKYIGSKYIRLTVVQLVTIGIVFIIPLIGTGPFWKMLADTQTGGCKTGWWQLVTYTLNFHMSVFMCQSHLWFLSSLMQYFLFTVIMLFIFKRWPKIAIGVCALAILGGIISYAMYFSGADVFYPSNPIFTLSYLVDYTRKLYSLPNGHMAQYAIGLLAGYFIVKHPKPHFTKKQKIQLALSISGTFVSTFGGFLLPEVKIIKIIHNSLYTVVWATGVSALIILCSTGYGGVMNRLLSWRVFIPLGRLTLFAYLIHISIITVFLGHQRRSIHITHLYLLGLFLLLSVITFIVSYVCYICIQSPLEYIISLIFPRKSQKVKVEEEVKDIKKENNLTAIRISFFEPQ